MYYIHTSFAHYLRRNDVYMHSYCWLNDREECVRQRKVDRDRGRRECAGSMMSSSNRCSIGTHYISVQ